MKANQERKTPRQLLDVASVKLAAALDAQPMALPLIIAVNALLNAIEQQQDQIDALQARLAQSEEP